MYKLEYPYTENERINFIVEYNHQQGLKIETVDNFVEVEIETENIEDETLTETKTENHPTYYALEANEILVDGEVVIDPEYEEKQKQKERERIAKLSCTKRDFALMLQELGVDYFTTLKPLIESNLQAQLEWELCERLYRFNPMLDLMATQLGVTSEQLDGLFKYANGEITLDEFKSFKPTEM